MTVEALTTYLLWSMIFAGVVAVILALLLWRNLLVGERRNRFLIFLSTAAIIGIIFWLLQSSAMTFFTAPPTCNFCHEMTPNYDTWQKSRHAKINCLGCHLPPGGALTVFTDDLRALEEVIRHFAGAYPQIINKDSHVSKEMKEEVCERCHALENLRRFEVVSEIKMNHARHKKAKISCPRCHNRVVHLGARDYPYFNGLTMMQGCMRCHRPGKAFMTSEGEKAPTTCSTCHEADRALKVFGKAKPTVADFSDCRACHGLISPQLVREFDNTAMAASQIDCIDCHGEHFEDFNPQPDPKTCNLCHSDTSKKVVKKTHGEKIKTPFKRAKDVKCSFCHKPHSFVVHER